MLGGRGGRLYVSSATRMKFPDSTSFSSNNSRLPNIADLLIGRLVLSTADPINFVDIVVVGSIVVTPVMAVCMKCKFNN